MKQVIAQLTGIPKRIVDFYNNEKGGRWLYRNRCYVTVFFVLLLINVIAAIPMKAPMIIDEYLTFSDSAFLSGRYDWSGTYSAVPGTPYYGYTQGLLYLPLFYLPISVYSVFKCALMINACLMALVPVFILYILNQITGEGQSRNTVKMACAIAVGSYSAYIYNSKGVWNETMLMMCPWLLAALMFKLYNSQTSKKARFLWSLVLGASCVYYYALNARSLAGIAAVFCVLLLVGIILRVRMVSFLGLGLGGGLTYFVHKLAKHYLVSSLLLAGDRENITNSSFSFSGILERIHFETLFMALKGYWGNIYYAFIASFGLAGIAIIWFLYLLIKSIRDGRKTTLHHKQFIISMFSVLSLVGTWAMFFLVSYDKFVLKDFTKQDVMMYGRYFDAVIPLTILSSIGLFVANEMKKNRIVLAGCVLSGIILLAGTIVTGGMMVEQNSLSAQPLNMGISIAFAGDTYSGRTTWADVWILSGVVVAVLVLTVTLLKKNRYILAFGCMFVLYMYAAFNTLTEYCWSTSNRQYWEYTCYSDFFNELETKEISYNGVYFLSNGYRDRGINVQYAVPHQNLKQINYYQQGYKCLEGIQENSIIISNHDAMLDVFFDKMYIVENADFYVWCYGEGLGKQFAAEGYAVSGQNPIFIPQDECSIMAATGYANNLTAKAIKGNYSCQVTIKGKNLTQIPYETIMFDEIEDIKLQKYDDDEITILGYMRTDKETVKISFWTEPSYSNSNIESVAVSNLEKGGTFVTPKNELSVESSVILGNGGILYGQYMTFTPGEYLVSIEGNYLEGTNIDYCWGRGEYVTDVTDRVQYDRDKATFVMSVDEVRDNMEIRIWNMSDQPVTVKDIIIQPVLKEGRLQAHNEIGFCPIYMGMGDSFARGEFLTPVYESGKERMYFGKDNGIAIYDVDLETGEYCLEIVGEDVAVELLFLSEDGEQISTIEMQESQVGENRVSYTFINNRDYENAQIIINALSTSDFITEPNSGIVKISDISIIKK